MLFFNFQILSLLAIVGAVPVPEADPGRPPRVYNALITTNEKLLPSEVVSYSAPVLPFSTLGHPFPYLLTPPFIPFGGKYNINKNGTIDEEEKEKGKAPEDVETINEQINEFETIELNEKTNKNNNNKDEDDNDKKPLNTNHTFTLHSPILPITYLSSAVHYIPPVYSYGYHPFAPPTPLWLPQTPTTSAWDWTSLFDGRHLQKESKNEDKDKKNNEKQNNDEANNNSSNDEKQE